MKRVNNFPFYELGAAIAPLKDIKNETVLQDVAWLLLNAQLALRPLISGQVIELGFSKTSAQALYNALNAVLPLSKPLPSEMNKTLDYSGYDISEKTKVFEHVLSAELQQIDTYFVPKKGIYSTSDLIEKTEEMFLAVIEKEAHGFLTEEAREDLREAGKCIAFDLATAAGFHIGRATEIILVSYVVLVTGTEPKSSGRNWGAYIKTLEDKGCDAKVCASLIQMKDLHRNPIIHPEATLTMTEALGLMGIAQSAIGAMIQDMHKRKPVEGLSAAKYLTDDPGVRVTDGS